MSFEHRILERLRLVLPDEHVRYDLHEPKFMGNELQYVRNCIESGWVSSVGSYVNQFENQLVNFTGVNHAIATVNGTAALHIAYLVAGVEQDDEILVPALTFVATANAISYCGAVPHFVDSETETLGVDPKALQEYLKKVTEIKDDACFNKKTGRRIRALCVTHIFGHPANLDALLEVCDCFHLVLIEDAAEALGSLYKGRHVGNVSIIAALSFNGNKIITTGGGGAVLTNNLELAEQARHLTTTAKRQHQWQFVHDCVGYNYRLPNINAALGCAQLERIDAYLKAKRDLAMQYQAVFSDMDTVDVLKESDDACSNYWLNALILKAGKVALRDSLLSVLSKAGIGSRPIWELMHRLPMYASCPRMLLSNAEKLWEQVILLPSSPGILVSDALAESSKGIVL